MQRSILGPVLRQLPGDREHERAVRNDRMSRRLWLLPLLQDLIKEIMFDF